MTAESHLAELRTMLGCPPLAATNEGLEPLEALWLARGLRDALDKLEADAVSEAILAGHTWQEVAGPLGVSRQAAHRKYAYARPRARPKEP